MNVLFVHNNFPAQYRQAAAALASDPANRVVAIGAATARTMAGVELHRYEFTPEASAPTHTFARRFDVECRRAEQVLYTAAALLRGGFVPDTVVVHSGWGENLPMRAVFPNARIITYCEFYYRPENQDVNFDPEFPRLTLDGTVALAAKNAASLLGLVDCDAGLSPTRWQRSTYPEQLREKIAVIHEGIDIDLVHPASDATFELPSGTILRKGDEVVTFVARNLEPVRGYHMLMRALPRVLRERPNAQVLIVGGDQVSYGSAPPPGESWKSHYLDEVKADLDLARVHYLGHLPYEGFLRMLQVSAAHVYLTYPFVLSWSFLEAMSSECLVIGADVAPVSEVVDGTNGILVPFFDTAALAGAIVEALARPRRHVGLRRKARATIVDRYDAKRLCIPATLALIRGL